jgi:two-component system, OmpR family, response regulator
LVFVHGKVVVVGCSTRTGAECGSLLASAGLSVVTQGYPGLETTMAVLEPDLAIAELQNGDPGETITLVRGRSDVPVLLLVPEGTSSTVTIAAFRAGADDVMEHPVNCQELLARVEALMRRRDLDHRVVVRDVVIDDAGHLAWRDDQPLALTPTEFQLLLVLARNADVVVSKRRLLSEVWGFDEFDVNVVEVHVSALRRKLEQFGPRLVETVRSHGYVIRGARTSGRSARPPAQRSVTRLHLVSSLVPHGRAGLGESGAVLRID